MKIMLPVLKLVAIMFVLTFTLVARTTTSEAGGHPDLAVTSFTLTYEPGWPDSFYMDFTVGNLGAASAGPFSVRVVSPLSGAVVQEYRVKDGLAPNAKNLRFRVPSGCGFYYRIEVDPYNEVMESNETNNVTIADWPC